MSAADGKALALRVASTTHLGVAAHALPTHALGLKIEAHGGQLWAVGHVRFPALDLPQKAAEVQVVQALGPLGRGGHDEEARDDHVAEELLVATERLDVQVEIHAATACAAASRDSQGRLRGPVERHR